MPHVAFKCPDLRMASLEADGTINQIVPIQTCLDCSLTRIDRSCHWDFADLYARQENSYDEQFSPSRFNGCDRELWLRANNDFWTDPAEQTYRVRGTAAHAVQELAADPRVIREARVYRTLVGAVDHLGGPVVVSVKPDAVYPGLSLIADTKTWKYLPRGNVIPGQIDPQPVKPAVIRQLSVGAWAWAKPDKVVYADNSINLAPPPVNIARAQESLRDGSGRGYLRQLVTLMDFTELEAWMRKRVLELNYVRSDPALAPGYCAEDLRWKCTNCPVRYLCGIPKELYVKPKTVKEKKPSVKRPSARRSTKPA